MDAKKSKEMYNLLLAFLGLFREKILLHSRQDFNCDSCLKKNHMKIINILYLNDYMSLTEIAKMIDIEKGSLTTLVDWLVENEFVSRSDDRNDRRKSLISLSPKGRGVADGVIEFYAQKLERLLKDKDPLEIQQFHSSLDYLVEFMKKI